LHPKNLCSCHFEPKCILCTLRWDHHHLAAVKARVPCQAPREAYTDLLVKYDEFFTRRLVRVVAPQLTVVTMNTTAPSELAGHVRDARAASVVSSGVVAHETTAGPGRSSHGRCSQRPSRASARHQGYRPLA